MKIITIILAMSLMGCSGPYDDLEKNYPAKIEISTNPIEASSIVLSSKHYKGAFSLTDIVVTRIHPNFIDISIDYPFKLFYSRVQIPIEAVTGCGKSCFGKNTWDADILLGVEGTEISFRNSKEILEWCYVNGLPMITGKITRNWMYENGELPTRKNYKQVSREEYVKQTKSRCMGY